MSFGIGFAIWLLLGALIGVVSLSRFVAAGRALAQRQLLSAGSYPKPLDRPAKISVLVAAKDEAANIEACLISLAAQDYPNFEIIAIDDRSDDSTGAILSRLQQQWPDRLRVVTVCTLPDGWYGKHHAMHRGVGLASGDWFLFTDADCVFQSPRALSVAMADALKHDAEFLTITPFLETPSLRERVFQPVCTLVLMLWFVPKKVNDPERRTAYANGAFMLIRRSAYEALGGHEGVRSEPNEDIQMARRAKRMAIRLRVAETDDLYRTRMYDTFSAAWHGWSRIFYGSLGSAQRLMVALFVLVALSIFPWTSLIVAVIMAVTCDEAMRGPWQVAALCWFTVVVFEQLFAWRVYRVLSVARGWSLAHLPGAVFATASLIHALLMAIGAARMTWRGCTYKRDTRDSAVDVAPVAGHGGSNGAEPDGSSARPVRL